MSNKEAKRWGAYFRKNGMPGIASGLIPEIHRGFALMTATLINVNGGYKGGRKATIDDFMPKRDFEEYQSTEQDAFALLSSLSGRKQEKVKKQWWRSKGKG